MIKARTIVTEKPLQTEARRTSLLPGNVKRKEMQVLQDGIQIQKEKNTKLIWQQCSLTHLTDHSQIRAHSYMLTYLL